MRIATSADVDLIKNVLLVSFKNDPHVNWLLEESNSKFKLNVLIDYVMHQRVHLVRDLNDAALDHPFDDDLKQIVRNFAALLKPMVETVDRFGLKRHYLKKRLVNVRRFYKWVRKIEARSEVVEKCKQRFEKNSDKLFTFLRYDGVPWNNNNAEHAIKAFARLRDVIKGICTAKAVQEYLILLSVGQTCVYQGIDFLDFLRSGEKSIDAFANNS